MCNDHSPYLIPKGEKGAKPCDRPEGHEDRHGHGDRLTWPNNRGKSA